MTTSPSCLFSQAQNMTKGMQQVQSQINLRQSADNPQSSKSDQHPLHLCTEVQRLQSALRRLCIAMEVPKATIKVQEPKDHCQNLTKENSSQPKRKDEYGEIFGTVCLGSKDSLKLRWSRSGRRRDRILSPSVDHLQREVRLFQQPQHCDRC